MTFRDTFTREVEGNLDSRVSSQDMRPSVEVWPGEDDFAHWVSAHEDRVRTIVCGTPEFKDSPFCGVGFH